VRQEPLLAPEPARVAGQTSIGTDDAMARDHDRDGIGAVRRTHRAGRAGSAHGAGELAVRRGPARRNLAQRVPHSTLEGRPLEVDRDPGERLDVAGEVPLETGHQTGGIGSRAQLDAREPPLQGGAPARPVLGEIERAEPSGVHRERQAAHG